MVGKKGSHLWSPALSYTADDLERDLSDKLTGSEPVRKLTVGEEGEKDGVGGKATDLPQTSPTSTDFSDQLTVSDFTYHVGDVVYLSAR